MLLVCFANVLKAQNTNDPDTVRAYLQKLMISKDLSDRKRLNEKISALTKSNSEADVLRAVSVLYQLGEKDSARALLKTVPQKFPSGNQARGMVYATMNKEANASDTENAYLSFVDRFPPLGKDKRNIDELALYDGLRATVAEKYARENNAAKSIHYFSLLDLDANKITCAVSLATAFYHNDDIVHGDYFSKISLQDALAKETGAEVKGGQSSKYINLSIYFSKLLLTMRHYSEAEKIIVPAYRKQEGFNANLSSIYVQALMGLKKETEAYQLLRQLFIAGKANAEEREAFKKISAKLKINQAIYAKDLKDARANTIKILEDKLKAAMVNIPAAGFTLQDLSGKMVSLADYKGKIVIIDFWATWCAPCKASFPAMQQAVNDFRNDPDVQFLFIHTFPRSAKSVDDAKAYIKESGYTFHVLMDESKEGTRHLVAEEGYGINGIPAKFVIDGSGKIRFKLSGFDGDIETGVAEVKMMVDMIRKSF